MEDAVDALKIGFAVLVFVIALTIFFKIVNLAKNTSDIVLYSIDKSNYYTYSEKNKGEHRIVTLKDIIPTIYRYNKENYGVTIINKSGSIIARFDLETEKAVERWTTTIKPSTKDNVLKNLNKILSILKNSIKFSNETDLKKLFNKIYGVREETQLAKYLPRDSKFAIEWDADEEILKRLKSDIYGNEEFKNHKAVCNGNGLVKTYGYDKQFTEYVLEIDLNEYVYDTGDISNYDSRKSGNYNLDEAMLYRRETNKMEIIYVEKE